MGCIYRHLLVRLPVPMPVLELMTIPQLLIDTDPGVDDALAILMAHAHADVLGLSIAAGNVGQEPRPTGTET